MNTLKNILILCTGNSCRSQMADGFLSLFLHDKANVYSAGVEVHGLNPRAVKVMAEDEVDISSNTSNHLDEYLNIDFDYVITVCDHADELCPVFPGGTEKIHHSFPDPAKATGTEEEILEAFRNTRDEIKDWFKDFADAQKV
jgi:arsenate reductase